MKHRFSRAARRFISLLLMGAIILAIAPSVNATVGYQWLQRLVNPENILLTNGETLAQIPFFDSLGDNWINFLKGGLIKQLIQGFLETGLATLALVISWSLINKLFRFLQTKAKDLQAKYTRTIRIGSKEVLRPEQVTRFLKQVITFSRFGVLGAIVLIYINAVLSFFPQTQPIASVVFTSVFNGISQVVLGIINYIPNLIFLIILCLIAYYTLKFIRFIFGEIESGHLVMSGFDPEWAASSQRIVQFLTVAFFVVIAFPYLPGAKSNAFQGISIFLGILFSLGSSSAISNIIAGILLTYTRAFRINDDIQIGDLWGTVIEKGLFVTRLLNYENQFVSIPNSTILNSNVLNYRTNPNPNPRDSKYPPAIWTVEVAVPANIPSQQVYEVLAKVARETPNVLQEPEPLILSFAFKNNYMTYLLKIALHIPTVLKTSSVVRKKILDEFANQGIILHPTQYIIYYPHEQEESQKINPFTQQIISQNSELNS